MVGLVAALVVAYFIGRGRKNRNNIEIPGQGEKEIPYDYSPLPPGTYFDPKPFTDALYNDIYSGPWTARNVQAYEDALKLGNMELTAVWNDWIDRYYKKDHETLLAAMSDEYWSFLDGRFRPIKTQLQNRLQIIAALPEAKR